MRTIAIVVLASGALWAPEALGQPTAPKPLPPLGPPVTFTPTDATATATAPAPATAPATATASAPPSATATAPATAPTPATAVSISPSPDADLPPDATYPPVDHRGEMWRAEMGYRGDFVSNASYEPFSEKHYFSQFSLAVSRTLFKQGRLSFAPGLGYDYGSSSASARGAGTSFSMHRLSVPLEGRVHFGPWGYAFLRVAPGLAAENAQLDDPSSPGLETKSTWMFSTDVSAGYALLIVPRFQRFDRTARLWVQGDVGYGWVAGTELGLTASPRSGSGANLANVGGVNLGTLSMEGAFFRLAAAVSF